MHSRCDVKPLQTLQLLVVAALWGASFLFIRVTSAVLGPVMTAFLRVLIGGLTLLAYAGFRRQPLEWRRYGGWIALVGLLNSTLPFVLIAFAELRLTASMSAILNSTAPLWTVLITVIGFGDALTPRHIGGLALGIVGVALLVGWSPLEPGMTTVLSILAMLGAAFCYGLSFNLTRARLHGAPPLSIVVGSLLSSSLTLLPLTPFSPFRSVPGLTVLLCLLVLALGCTSLAYLLYFPLVVNLGATRTAAVGFLVPVFGVVWASLFLGEALTLEKLLACAVILLGAALMTGISLQAARVAPHSPLRK